MIKLIKSFVALTILGASLTAWGHGDTLGDIKVVHPWMRAVPVPGMNGAGYMTIINTGSSADRLIAVETDWVKKAEIHETSEENGMMSMMPLPDGVEIPANSTVTLEPGAIHIMLMKTVREVNPKTRIPVTLVFEHAGKMHTQIVAQPLTGDSHQHH